MKKGLPSFLALSRAPVVSNEHFVKGFHVILGLATLLPALSASHIREGRQRTIILDLLFTDFVPSRHSRGVIHVGGPAVGKVARTGLADPVLGIVDILVAEMVLTKLEGLVKPVRIGSSR
jgi:hypothetical protein